MNKIIKTIKTKNFSFGSEDEKEWQITYYPKLVNGKDIIRLDWGGGNYKVWYEKDFMEHIKKLKGLNQV